MQGVRLVSTPVKKRSGTAVQGLDDNRASICVWSISKGWHVGPVARYACPLAGAVDWPHCLGTVPNIGIDLGRTEKVVWSGAPKQGFLLRPNDAFLIPFSLLWTGLVLTAFFGVRQTSAPWSIAIFPAIFVLLGVYLTVGRFAIDIMARTRTTYAVTNERVIIQSGIFSQSVKSLNLGTLSDVTMTERGNGSGTSTFGPGYPWGRWGSGMQWPGMPQQPMFEGIPDVRTVYSLIRDTQRAT
jgi:hypothetical protein